MSIREEMLKEAITKAASHKLEDVAAQLPSDFDLDQAELDAAQTAKSKSLENIEPPRANGDGPSHIDPANTTPQPDRDVEAEIIECDNKLIELQQEARVRRNDLTAARGELDKAKQALHASGRTPETEVRAYIARSQSERARVAELSRGQNGESSLSHVDIIRAGSRGHSSDRGFGPGAAGRIINTPWGPQRTGKYGARTK